VCVLRVLVQKLEMRTLLTDADTRALLALEGHIRHVGPREDVLVENDRPDDIVFFVRGFGFRYKLLGSGRRQITAYLLPGDCCCPDVLLSPAMDHSIATLSPATVIAFPRHVIADLLAAHPGLERALRWAALVEGAIAREWVVNLGQRTASERLAHLLCETFTRLRIIGLTQGDSCEFPLTQAELADTLGLSTVHVNRTLQDLRRDGLITLKGRTLVVHDLPALQRLSIFDPAYLHQRDRADGPGMR
jgi:CRP-like cAMP-binding protein